MRKSTDHRLALLTLCLAAAGCADPAGAARGVVEEPGDGPDDAFTVPGGAKADVAGIADGSSEACAVLKFASEATLEQLDVDAGLDARAARNIVAARGGAALPGSDGHVYFDGLEALDRVKYVGPKAFKLLLGHTRTTGYSCGQVAVQVLATNDFHGNLKPPAGSGGRIVTGADPNVDRVDAGGVEFLHTHMARLEATNPNTVVVAAGDIIGATPLLSALFHDEPTVESMNLLGLDIAAVGNHEFDEGVDELLRMQAGGCHPTDGCQDGDDFAGADWQYLGANVIEDATGDTLLPPYEIRRFGMARVAFIGMTLEGTPLVTSPTGTVGLHFLDEADTVNALVPELKAQGVGAIVVLLHEGGFATGLYNGCAGISGPLFDIARRLDPAVDVVVAGHTNAAHVCDVEGKLVTSAASAGRLITDIDLTVDEVTGEVVAKTAENVIVTRTVDKAAPQTALIARWEALAAPFANRVVGTIAGDLVKLQNPAGESPLGDVIADAQLSSTRATGVRIAFMNPGGVRTDLLVSQSSGGEAPGELTYGEVFAVQPFSNIVVTVSLTGAQIVAALEQQWVAVPGAAEKANVLQVSEGFTYTWDAKRPIGSRILAETVKLDGVVLDPTATYRVAMNNFIADGGDGFSVFKAGTDRVAGAIDVDAFSTYVGEKSPLAVPATTRIVRLD
ncbi:5'-nucleotidase C-terminal domain-containing protein [Myxococcota bacterium]|nr:5'-nucleotidase C-terminal domain-containing protein [Myxococcota bacterium]